jgi:trimethylamine corrinoid protein
VDVEGFMTLPGHSGARHLCGDREAIVERARRAFDLAVFETDKRAARDSIKRALDEGASPESLVFEVVIPSLQVACDPGAAGSSLAQHFMASLIACEATEDLVQRFTTPPETAGRVVIGTARGDFHGLGAHIVAGCLRASMIEVTDLGRDVEALRFVEESLACDADVICISSMMLHTALGDRGPSGVRRLLRDAGLEQRLKVVVGGAPYNHDPGLWLKVGADAWADDGLAAGPVVAGLIERVRA